MKNISSLKTSELVAEFNQHSDKPIKAWKGKVADLQAKLLKLKPDLYYFEATGAKTVKAADLPSDRLSDVSAPKAAATKVKAQDADRGAIRRYCEELLLKAKGTDEKTKRPLGMPYATILEAVQKKFPKADTSLNCLRWYATKMNKRTGKERVVMPMRPKALIAA